MLADAERVRGDVDARRRGKHPAPRVWAVDGGPPDRAADSILTDVQVRGRRNRYDLG